MKKQYIIAAVVKSRQCKRYKCKWFRWLAGRFCGVYGRCVIWCTFLCSTDFIAQGGDPTGTGEGNILYMYIR